MRRTVFLAVACIALLAAGCGGGGGTQAKPLTHNTPSEVLKAALAAAKKSGAAHYVLKSIGPAKGEEQMVTGDSGITDGRQVIIGAGARWEALVVNGKVFISGDAKGLEDEGFPSSVAVTYAGKWISIAPTDSPYKSVIAELALYPALQELSPTGKLTLTAPTTRDGRQVVGVRGSVRTSKGSTAKGTVILYVSTTSPTVPVAYSATATDQGQTAVETGTFSDWGEPVHLTAPTPSIAFSKISAVS
jgi:hypothetical protein